MTTLADALRSTVSRLANANAPQADAEELLGRLLGLSRAEIYLDPARVLTPTESQRLGAWLLRRQLGEPVQYITGRAAFRNLDLRVDPRVLIPRPETEGLVEVVLNVLRQQRRWWRRARPRVLDLGTGSGAIALAIAGEWSAALVTGTDVSSEALEVARDNALSHSLDDRVRFLEGDWFDAVGADELFEVIVSNPPYIATGEWDSLPPDVRDHEPPRALFSGSTGLEALREIIDLAPDHLVSGGLLAVELAEMRAYEVASWLDGANDWVSVQLIDDLAGRPRVLLAWRQIGPAIAPAQWNEER